MINKSTYEDLGPQVLLSKNHRHFELTKLPNYKSTLEMEYHM